MTVSIKSDFVSLDELQARFRGMWDHKNVVQRRAVRRQARELGALISAQKLNGLPRFWLQKSQFVMLLVTGPRPHQIIVMANRAIDKHNRYHVKKGEPAVHPFDDAEEYAEKLASEICRFM